MKGEQWLGEVVSTRSLAELLDPASLGLLIKPARGIWVPGGWLGCWLAGQGKGQFQVNSYWPFQPLEDDASAASASSTWVGGQFQANFHWLFQPLGEDVSAVSASAAWVASSWVVWVGVMQGGDFPSPLLASLVPGLWLIVQCCDLWK